jgi:hypothetical protein
MQEIAERSDRLVVMSQHSSQFLQDVFRVYREESGQFFGLETAIANTTIALLDNDTAREAMRNRAYLYARHMVWDRVAQSYRGVFARVCANRKQPARVALPIQAAEKNAPGQLMSV